MKVPAFVVAAVFCLSATFATGQTTAPQSASKADYTDKEYRGLMACVGLADTAWTTAERKLKGVSLEEAKKRYGGKLDGPAKDLPLRVIDKVYSDKFSNSWDYAVSFYRECAQNVADVPQDRSGMATYCMQNSMIGMTAQEYKEAGLPAEKATEHFAKFKADAPKLVIGWVYANSWTRADAGMEVWKTCAQPLRKGSALAAPAYQSSVNQK